MIDVATIKIGDKVHYKPPYGRVENGIVKRVPEGQVGNVFVVYNCAGEWDNYQDYTAALTHVKDLYPGWCHVCQE